jgi:hypothetical protein
MVLAIGVGTPLRAEAAKVIGVGVLDKEYILVQISDGDVAHEAPGENVSRYSPELDTAVATQTGSWLVKSDQDANYGSAGRSPTACSRKKKLSGQAQEVWVSSDYAYEYTYQHWIFLKLPSPLQQGMAYALEIAPATNADVTTWPFTFDVYSSRSEAVHVNLVGYAPDAPHKAADLYAWLATAGHATTSPSSATRSASTTSRLDRLSRWGRWRCGKRAARTSAATTSHGPRYGRRISRPSRPRETTPFPFGSVSSVSSVVCPAPALALPSRPLLRASCAGEPAGPRAGGPIGVRRDACAGARRRCRSRSRCLPA